MRAWLMTLWVMALAVPAGAQTVPEEVRAGRALAEKNCAPCHAVGSTGASKRRGAPPFRVLNRRYDVDNLQEAFVEGIAVGHRDSDMPEFEFSPERTDAIIAYIKSLDRKRRQ
jgi:mono/diheme cytochrome c family protein